MCPRLVEAETFGADLVRYSVKPSEDDIITNPPAALSGPLPGCRRFIMDPGPAFWTNHSVRLDSAGIHNVRTKTLKQ